MPMMTLGGQRSFGAQAPMFQQPQQRPPQANTDALDAEKRNRQLRQRLGPALSGRQAAQANRGGQGAPDVNSPVTSQHPSKQPAVGMQTMQQGDLGGMVKQNMKQSVLQSVAKAGGGSESKLPDQPSGGGLLGGLFKMLLGSMV